jgi:hypothetical protein
MSENLGDVSIKPKNIFFKSRVQIYHNPNPRIKDCERKTRAISELANYAFDIFVLCIGVTIVLNFVNSIPIEENLKGLLETGIFSLISIGTLVKLNEKIVSEAKSNMTQKSKEILYSVKDFINSKSTISLDDESAEHFFNEIGLEKGEYQILIEKLTHLNSRLDDIRSKIAISNLKASLEEIVQLTEDIKKCEKTKLDIKHAFQFYNLGVDREVLIGKLDVSSRMVLNNLRSELESIQQQTSHLLA